MMKYNLKELKQAAEEACLSAYQNKELIDGCINWADLHCLTAKKYEDDDGVTGYEVIIEEADPSQSDLHIFIDGFLRKRGYEGIETIFEW